MRQALLGVSLALVLFTGCQVSESESLGGSYYLVNRDAEHVYIRKESNGKNSVVIDEQIVDFKVMNNYVLVLRKVAESPDCYDKNNVPTIITHYTNEDEYWVIDLKQGKEIGPLKEDAYHERLKELRLTPVKLRAPSSYVSNTEAFHKEIKECARLSR